MREELLALSQAMVGAQVEVALECAALRAVIKAPLSPEQRYVRLSP